MFEPKMSPEAKRLYAKTLVGALSQRLGLLQELVNKLKRLSEQAADEAETASRVDHYREGIAAGKQIAYREAAQALKDVLDGV